MVSTNGSGVERRSADLPRVFPQFGEHYYATYFLDPHGFKLEVVCPTEDLAAPP